MRLEERFDKFAPEIKTLIRECKRPYVGKRYEQREMRISVCSHKCLRFQYFFYKGYEAEDRYNENEIGAFRFGSLLHLGIEAYSIVVPQLMEYEVETEIDIDGKRITGHADLVVYKHNIIDKRRLPVPVAVIDLKTTSELRWIRKYGINEDYLVQLAAYVRALNARRGSLLFIEKKNPHSTATVTLTRRQLEPFYKRFEQNVRSIIRALEEDELPPKSENGLCKFCAYKMICDKEQ